MRHPCRVGEYPCGGYGQVGAGQASWHASARRQVEKQRHVPMVLVKHGSEGEKHRGEERGSEKQGTGGEQERRKRARSSSTQPSTCRRAPSTPPRPSGRRVVPRRLRYAPCARLAASTRVLRRCRRACAAGPGRGSPSRHGASGRISRPTARRRPGAP